ncbi:MAG TPA: hypothetical protein VKC62_03210 [Gaiellaceae bacterium]|nr:hypothetical protein [Gaiellaceae bacterium]
MRLLLSAVVLLGSHGIGAVHFGTPKTRAVAALTRTLGAPTSRGVNHGCGARYTEVYWGGLSAEFRSNVFSGFRYKAGGPRLATAKGITLGSSMAELRRAYGALRFVGTDRWGAAGLVFYDDGKPLSATRLRHIVEIKTGTCGDF